MSIFGNLFGGIISNAIGGGIASGITNTFSDVIGTVTDPNFNTCSAGDESNCLELTGGCCLYIKLEEIPSGDLNDAQTEALAEETGERQYPSVVGQEVHICGSYSDKSNFDYAFNFGNGIHTAESGHKYRGYCDHALAQASVAMATAAAIIVSMAN